MTTRKKLSALVDELGTIKASMADLSKRENDIKAALIAAGSPLIEGQLWQAAISTCERETLDRASVEKLLTPKQFQRCLKSTTVTSVRVSARTEARAKVRAA
jgi:hypothetical protein